MDKIVIEGIDAYNGTYELDMEYLTMRELHRIKQLSGIRLGEIPEGIRAWDSDLLVAFAAVALERAGKHVEPDMLWDAQTGTIRFEFGEDDAGPPGETTAEPVSDSNGNQASSGESSGVSSESQESDPSRTGPVSSAGSAFAPVTSAT